ncbi:MAG: IMP dehydrogenase [Patescibacteria group bacterium]
MEPTWHSEKTAIHFPNAADGLTAEAIFATATDHTFDDFNILPPPIGRPRNLDLSSQLARGFKINLPIVSSPMDTVTESRTAIHMALNGGIGILHFNLAPDEAAAQVREVKRYQMGFIFDPCCRKPSQPISEVARVKMTRGFSTILITEDGTPGSKLLGMVTRSDVDLEENPQKPLGEVMTKLQDLQVFSKKEVPTLASARDHFRQKRKLNKVPILNEDGTVFALITHDDVVKSAYPIPLVNDNAQLRVGAAISTFERDRARTRLLVEAGVDILVIDAAQGASGFAVDQIQAVKTAHPGIPVVAGNVVTPAQAKMLVEAGADALRVGMGSGSICITREHLGIGRPQASAIFHVANYARHLKQPIPVIADGGIRRPADIIKALAFGASTVMVGKYVAGCDEAPGEVGWNDKHQRVKRYRGMGSISAQRDGGARRYGDASLNNSVLVPQGEDAGVAPTGSLDKLLVETAAALRKGLLDDLGVESIAGLHQAVDAGTLRFTLQSTSGKVEGGAHDVMTRASNLK